MKKPEISPPRKEDNPTELRDLFGNQKAFARQFPHKRYFTPLIQEFVKPGSKNVPKLSRYSIAAMVAEENGDYAKPYIDMEGRLPKPKFDNLSEQAGLTKSRRETIDSRIYLDGEFGLALCFDKLPCAVVGFDKNIVDHYVINQLQIAELYNYGNRARLHPEVFVENLRWEKLLLRAVEITLVQLGATHFAVRSAANNFYTDPENGRLPMSRAIIRYDATARRSGYKKGDDGNYHKIIEQPATQ